MNIEDAKGIALSLIFEKLNAKLAKQDDKDAWYFAPWREENTASVHVNLKNNQWYDHGEGKGGDAVNLVCRTLKANGEDHTVADALRWLRNMTVAPIKFAAPVAKEKKAPYWKLIRAEDLEDLGLVRYLNKRGIPTSIAAQFVQEVYVRNPENNIKLYAIGLKNEDNGYELRNPFFKGCVAPKTITFIRGHKPKPQGIHFFEGLMDFLTAVTINKGPFKDDAIVLNSLSCISHAVPYVKNYGYRFAYTWLDNDQSGKAATATLAAFFKAEADLYHHPLNKIYTPHKDVNAWHMHNLNLML